MTWEHLEKWLETTELGPSQGEHTDHIWSPHKQRCFGGLHCPLAETFPPFRPFGTISVMQPTLQPTAGNIPLRQTPLEAAVAPHRLLATSEASSEAPSCLSPPDKYALVSLVLPLPRVHQALLALPPDSAPHTLCLA